MSGLPSSLQTRLKVMHVVSETPLSFLLHLKEMTFIEQKPLRYALLTFVFLNYLVGSARNDSPLW